MMKILFFIFLCISFSNAAVYEKAYAALAGDIMDGDITLEKYVHKTASFMTRVLLEIPNEEDDFERLKRVILRLNAGVRNSMIDKADLMFDFLNQFDLYDNVKIDVFLALIRLNATRPEFLESVKAKKLSSFMREFTILKNKRYSTLQFLLLTNNDVRENIIFLSDKILSLSKILSLTPEQNEAFYNCITLIPQIERQNKLSAALNILSKDSTQMTFDQLIFFLKERSAYVK